MDDLTKVIYTQILEAILSDKELEGDSSELEEGYGTGYKSSPYHDMLPGERRRFRAALFSGNKKSSRSSTMSKSSTPKHQSEDGFHPMKVGYDDREKAKAEGMKWHKDKKVWYHSTEEKANSSEFERH